MFAQAWPGPPKFMAIVLLQLAPQVCKLGGFVDRIQSVAAGLRGLALQPEGPGCHSRR